MRKELENVRQKIASHLEQIAPLFTDDVKLTFVARFPGFPEREMLVTNDDDLHEVQKTVYRSLQRETK